MKKAILFTICLTFAAILLSSCGNILPAASSDDDDPPLTREENTGEPYDIPADTDSGMEREEEGPGIPFGGDWPDNEFTRLVPKPDFRSVAASASDDEFTAAFLSVTVDKIKAYAEKIKKSGFTVDAEEEDQNVYGIAIYSYTAYNDEGYCVELSFASGTGGLTISK